MTDYRLTGENWILRAADNARIPLIDDPLEPNTNPHYLEYKQWLADGGVPEPADPPSAEQRREQFKAERAAAVQSITVTTETGKTFDGDEIAQGRMARAILALPLEGTVTWVLADNSAIQVTAAELTEALALAGAEQARLWVDSSNNPISQ